MHPDVPPPANCYLTFAPIRELLHETNVLYTPAPVLFSRTHDLWMIAGAKPQACREIVFERVSYLFIPEWREGGEEGLGPSVRLS